MAINKNKVMEVAQKFVEKGQTDKAIKEYLKIVEEDPKDVRIWLKIGDLYAKKNAKQEATETYLRVAEFYSEQGFYLKAVAVYKQVLKLDPRLIHVNLKLAEVYRQLGLLSDAMQQYELVAAFYHREGKVKEALATIRELVELDPENVATRIKLAELYSKESMTKEAIAEFAKAADYLRAHSRTDDFIKVAERLVWHEPENHAINKELASLYLKRNDPRHALQKLQVCFKAEPRDVETLSLLASAFLALDQKAKTVSVWKELARIYQEQNQTAAATEIFRKILAVEPNDADAIAAVGGRRAVGTGSSQAMPAVQSSPVVSFAPSQSQQMPVAPPRIAVPVESRTATPAQGVPRVTGPSISQRIVTPLAPSGTPSPAPTPRRPGVRDSASFEAIPDPERTTQAKKRAQSEPLREDLEVDMDDLSTTATTPQEEIERTEHVPTPRGAVADRNEEIGKILTDADVYIKYNLHQKALDHLQKVFELDPRHVEAREKLKTVLQKTGRVREAQTELVRLVELTGQFDKRRATGYLRELAGFDPDDARIRSLASRFQIDFTDERTPTPIAVDESELEELELETEGPSMNLGGEPSELMVETSVPHEGLDFEMDDLGGEGAGAAMELSEADAELAFDADAEDATAHTAASDMQTGSFDEITGEQGAIREFDPNDAGIGAVTPGTSLEDDLDEAEFFVSQNLFSEARAILSDLLGRYPNHPLVRAKLADLNTLEGGAPTSTTGGSQPTVPASREPVRPEVTPTPPPAARKPAVIAKPLGVEDADTHYDLGLAYKEMGLHDEAIKEFYLVRETPGRAVQCHLMIGLCHAERGKMTEAVNEFKQGLYVEGITDRESVALYFELGAAYEALADAREALYYYEKVHKRDPRFREVDRRIESLKSNGAKAKGNGSPSQHERDEIDGAIDSIFGNGSGGDFSIG